MSAFYLEDKDGVKNYIKSIETANETIEWTTRPDRDLPYTNSSGFLAYADMDLIKFHSKDNYPNIADLHEYTNYLYSSLIYYCIVLYLV